MQLIRKALLIAGISAITALPAEALSIVGLLEVAKLQITNGEYDRACKTMGVTVDEAISQDRGERDVNAYRRLRDQACELAGNTTVSTVDPIKQSCMKEWKTDYTMVKWCYDQQTKAKRELGL